MVLKAEWRANNEVETVLVVDENDTVRAALPANPEVLGRLLTDTGDLNTWRGELAIEGPLRSPDAWGKLVIARAATGEVLNMDPERFWEGIYTWFRSRGVDYDTPVASLT